MFKEYIQRRNSMKNNATLPETTSKSIRFENELIEKIEEMGREAERDFSSQVRFMLKEYIRMKENR